MYTQSLHVLSLPLNPTVRIQKWDWNLPHSHIEMNEPCVSGWLSRNWNNMAPTMMLLPVLLACRDHRLRQQQWHGCNKHILFTWLAHFSGVYKLQMDFWFFEVSALHGKPTCREWWAAIDHDAHSKQQQQPVVLKEKQALELAMEAVYWLQMEFWIWSFNTSLCCAGSTLWFHVDPKTQPWFSLFHTTQQ